MIRPSLFLSFSLLIQLSANAQDIVSAAVKFTGMLDSNQKTAALYPFDTDERYQFHYFPVNDRKGIAMDQLNSRQKEAVIDLMKTCLNEQTVSKATDIMQLEVLLKELEKRKAEDHFRDPGKYYFTVFGLPASNTIWGWRLDGHHVCFSFSVQNRTLVSGTPGFLGANPAVVQDGAQKGKEILKDEKDLGFALLHSLSGDQLKKALINATAPGDILTYVDRKAMIEHPSGLRYAEMNTGQQQK
ncbi:MAG TPA: DUF3500 domain-containing protein, partial [Puia sp.]|nr:DUF3500 domain-containing protein [Puia sp.]